jgi:hypothetical protein
MFLVSDVADGVTFQSDDGADCVWWRGGMMLVWRMKDGLVECDGLRELVVKFVE